jgi:hypothetical protein
MTCTMATNFTGFASACQDAMMALLRALAVGGQQRRGHLSDAKLAADKALHDAQTNAEWYLADNLRRGIKDVEARLRDAS